MKPKIVQIACSESSYPRLENAAKLGSDDRRLEELEAITESQQGIIISLNNRISKLEQSNESLQGYDDILMERLVNLEHKFNQQSAPQKPTVDVEKIREAIREYLARVISPPIHTSELIRDIQTALGEG